VGVAVRWASCFSHVALSKNALGVAPSQDTDAAALAAALPAGPPDGASPVAAEVAPDADVEPGDAVPPVQAAAASAAAAKRDASRAGLDIPCILLLLQMCSLIGLAVIT